LPSSDYVSDMFSGLTGCWDTKDSWPATLRDWLTATEEAYPAKGLPRNFIFATARQYIHFLGVLNPVQCRNLLCDFFYSVGFSPQPLNFVYFPRLLVRYIYTYPPHPAGDSFILSRRTCHNGGQRKSYACYIYQPPRFNHPTDNWKVEYKSRAPNYAVLCSYFLPPAL